MNIWIIDWDSLQALLEVTEDSPEQTTVIVVENAQEERLDQIMGTEYKAGKPQKII